MSSEKQTVDIYLFRSLQMVNRNLMLLIIFPHFSRFFDSLIIEHFFFLKKIEDPTDSLTKGQPILECLLSRAWSWVSDSKFIASSPFHMFRVRCPRVLLHVVLSFFMSHSRLDLQRLLFVPYFGCCSDVISIKLVKSLMSSITHSARWSHSAAILCCACVSFRVCVDLFPDRVLVTYRSS